MELDRASIEAAIVKQVATEIMSDDGIWSKVRQAVDARISKLFSEVVDTRVTEAIDAMVRDGFDREYQAVTSFGQPVGEKTTIRKELEKQIGGYWNTFVDRHGKPTTNTYSDRTTRAEWMMSQLVAADFQGEMKQHVVNVAGSLKDKLRLELHETVNKLLSEIFSVRSADDLAASRNDKSVIHPRQTPPRTPGGVL